MSIINTGEQTLAQANWANKAVTNLANRRAYAASEINKAANESNQNTYGTLTGAAAGGLASLIPSSGIMDKMKGLGSGGSTGDNGSPAPGLGKAGNEALGKTFSNDSLGITNGASATIPKSDVGFF